jgi:hypothetical protein
MTDDEKKPWPTSKAAMALIGKAKVPEGEVKTTPKQITLICQMMDSVIKPDLPSRDMRSRRPGPILG